ncbi:hypothetical protein GCM10009710_34570 [Aeromicrobium alkaliterrae]|uniref:Peptidoglycan recognition protein family domain-containing protein n=1 Tax=Aeromicrobium alkaliterrae TaxID=302168 RepID=A0ABN2KAK1_9ACTN
MRRTRRAVLVRAVPLLAVSMLVAALLSAVVVTSMKTEDTAGTPTQVEKREFEVTPAPDREEYTAQDAALVAVADPTVPTIQNGTVVAELAPHDLPSFELLGVTWTGGVPAEVAEVQVRWQQDGTWSDWTILDPEDEPAEGGIPGTEPKWVGASQAAQARIVATEDIDPAGLTLVTVDPGASPTLTQAAGAQPNITSRAQWGARAYGGAGCGAAPDNGTFQGTIVHHTAGSNVYTAAQSVGIVRSIQAYHMDGQRWCDIGYNFLVDRYGQIFEGRAGGITKTPYGAHAGNTAVNANTTGVSLMGEFTSEVPPQAMKDALVRLVAWRHSLFNTPAKGAYSIGGVTIQRIDGHRSVKSTACPGQQVFTWINAAGGLRDQVAAAMTPTGLVQVPGRPEVWLLNGSSKHHVTDVADLSVLASRLGWVRQVPAAQVDPLPTGGPASRYVHDPRTGTLYLLQADGTKHRFATQDTIASYGYSFSSYVNIAPGQADAFATGPEVGDFFRIESGPEVYRLSGTQRRYVSTVAALQRSAAGGNTYVASMSAGGAAKLAAGPALLEPHTLVRESNAGTVYLSVGDGGLLHIPSFDLAAEAGATKYTILAAGSLASTPITKGSLSPFVTCGGTTYLASGGTFRPVSGSGTAGWTPTALPDTACASLPKSAATVSAPFLMQVAGRGEVYLLEAQQLHHVRSWDRLMQLTGGSAPRLIGWSAATANLVGVGGPELAANTAVQFAGQPEVYRADGRTIQHVTTYAALVRLGGGKVPPIEQLPVAQKPYYSVGAPIS